MHQKNKKYSVFDSDDTKEISTFLGEDAMEEKKYWQRYYDNCYFVEDGTLFVNAEPQSS